MIIRLCGLTSIFVFSFASLFPLPSFAQLSSFSVSECRDFIQKEMFEYRMVPEKAGIRQSWVLASWDKGRQLISTEYQCANKRTRKLSWGTGSELSNTAIAEIRCNKSFLIERRNYPRGEDHSNDYIDLRTCDSLGFGDKEFFSADGRFGVLVRDAEVRPGYRSNTGSLFILTCDNGSCTQRGKQLFKEMGFADFTWPSNNTLTFTMKNVRSALQPAEMQPLPQFCTVKFEDRDYDLECKDFIPKPL